MTDTLFRRPDPVDWFRVLSDLDYAGHCNAAVAEALSIPMSTLRHYKEGKTPSYDNGEAICLYYAHRLNQPVPRTARFMAANLHA